MLGRAIGAGGAGCTVLGSAASVAAAEARVEVSALIASLRLHNPWGEAACTIRRGNGASETARGPILELPTRVGERLSISR